MYPSSLIFPKLKKSLNLSYLRNVGLSLTPTLIADPSSCEAMLSILVRGYMAGSLMESLSRVILLVTFHLHYNPFHHHLALVSLLLIHLSPHHHFPILQITDYLPKLFVFVTGTVAVSLTSSISFNLSCTVPTLMLSLSLKLG